VPTTADDNMYLEMNNDTFWNHPTVTIVDDTYDYRHYQVSSKRRIWVRMESLCEKSKWLRGSWCKLKLSCKYVWGRVVSESFSFYLSCRRVSLFLSLYCF